jgi:uncharacterized DUF497 family protein/uncharacterized protein (DUF4415 family)
MGIAYDPVKNERNIRERRLSFERAADFDFSTALVADYFRNAEVRRIAVGYLDKRLHLSVTSRSRMESESSVSARRTRGRLDFMASRKPLIDENGEIREIEAGDVSLFRPFSTLPKAEQKVLLNLCKRGPQKAPKKIPISIWLSPDVAEGLRATGNGWQRRADKALRSWLEETSRVRSGHAASSS